MKRAESRNREKRKREIGVHQVDMEIKDFVLYATFSCFEKRADGAAL